MKIIELGNMTKKIKCSGCSSKLEYELGDVRAIDAIDEMPAKQVIDCPVCGMEIFLTGANSFPWALVKKD